MSPDGVSGGAEGWRRAAAGLLRGSLARGATAWLRVRTASMAPAIEAGDEVLLRGVPPSALVAGDVVCVRRGDLLVVHRLLRRPCRASRTLTTGGDAGRGADPRVPWHDLVGVVVLVRRGGRVLPGPGPLRARARAWATLAREGLRGAWRRLTGRGGEGRGRDDGS